MISPRTLNKTTDEPERTTVRLPEPERNFTGWGPRLRFL